MMGQRLSPSEYCESKGIQYRCFLGPQAAENSSNGESCFQQHEESPIAESCQVKMQALSL